MRTRNFGMSTALFRSLRESTHSSTSGVKRTQEKMAGPTGFEPATSRLTIWRPNQLNDGPSKLNVWQNDVTDKTISSGWSRLKFLFSYSICPVPLTQHFPGRRNRDRTCDIHRVKVALCQLSYPPDFSSNLGGMLPTPHALVNRISRSLCHFQLARTPLITSHLLSSAFFP